jgi:hypothetical protein
MTSINNDTVWIDVKCKGEITDTEYFGRFSVKRYLTHRERGDAVREGEVLCRGLEDLAMKTFYMAAAFIAANVVDSDAAWYKKDRGLDLVDEQPIWAISAEIRKLQKPVVEAVPTEIPSEGAPKS